MSWEPDQKPRRVPEAAFRDYDGEAVVVLPGGAMIHVLNPAGRRVFDLLDGEHTVSAIADALCEEFEVELDRATQDVNEFLDQLQENGMIA